MYVACQVPYFELCERFVPGQLRCFTSDVKAPKVSARNLHACGAAVSGRVTSWRAAEAALAAAEPTAATTNASRPAWCAAELRSTTRGPQPRARSRSAMTPARCSGGSSWTRCDPPASSRLYG
jgi:hypothetical protein